MQIKIKVYLEVPLTLPISYHHIVQAVVYNLMGNENGITELHDHGFNYGKREYKLFTFGPLLGKYKIEKELITFYNDITLEIRALDSSIILKIQDSLLNNGIQLGTSVYKNIETTIINKIITYNKLKIKMISPICVYRTNSETKYTTYYKPSDPSFEELFYDNFFRKYSSINEILVPPVVSLSPLKITDSDKYITTYKKTVIEAYKGIYELSGETKYLDFLYNTGLGAKNSQGFGMFEIIE